MNCKIEGCCKPVMYKKLQLCQMHYFRKMRTGSYELAQKQVRGRVVTPNGYVRVHAPGHVLRDKGNYVFEHRKVVFDAYGYELPNCEICGAPTNWGTCHIDHKDNNRQNNDISNLRPVCRGCNTFRDYPPQHSISGHHSLTINGVTKTPTEWARWPGAQVCGHQIMQRKKAGMSDFDAVFAPKKTHKAKLKELKGNHKEAA